MPEKVTNIANTSINTIYVIGGLFTLFSIIGSIVSSYLFFVIKTFNSKIKELKQDAKENENDLEDIEKRLIVLETKFNNPK